MKFENSKMLTKLASVVGVTGVSLLVNLQVGAKEVFGPNLNIIPETSHNHSSKNQTQNTPNKVNSSLANKTRSRSSVLIAQTSGSLNPNPSILQECPYNRAACGDRTTPGTPEIPPSVPPVIPAPDRVPVETKPSTGTEQTSDKNLVQIAEANGSFNTLVDALKAAGLAEALQGEGPFTVFAPTDEAFGKLPQDAVKELLQPKNKEVLVKILRYHVVSQEVLSKDLKSGEVKSLDGTPISVKVEPKGVMVNDANVTTADVKGSNGVIHIIDNVILPPDL